MARQLNSGWISAGDLPATVLRQIDERLRDPSGLLPGVVNEGLAGEVQPTARDVPDEEWNRPYESIIEAEFEAELCRHLKPGLLPRRQADVATEFGVFRLDFLIADRRATLAFECDGRDYHDAQRDFWRDAAILHAGHCSRIYRIRGEDIWNRLDDALFVISRLEPDLFGVRGALNLETLASRQIRQAIYDPYERDVPRTFEFRYHNEEGEPLEETLSIRRYYGWDLRRYFRIVWDRGARNVSSAIQVFEDWRRSPVGVKRY